MIEGRFRPYTAAVAVDDSLHDGQPDAVALKPLVAMQTLKHAKESVCVSSIEAYTIVLHKVFTLVDTLVSADDYDWGRLQSGEFEGIGQEIGENLLEQRRVRVAPGKRSNSNIHDPVWLLPPELIQDFIDESGDIYWACRERLTARLRKEQQIPNQQLHSSCACDDMAQDIASGVRQLCREIPLQDRRKAADGPQWGTQIVRD